MSNDDARRPTASSGEQQAPQDQSIGELLAEATRDMGDLLRKEVQLAKQELRDEASATSKAGAKLGGAAVTGHLAMLLASFALAWGLAEVIPAGWAFLIVAALYAIVAAVLYVKGRNELRQISPMQQTMESLEDDASWAREQMKQGDR